MIMRPATVEDLRREIRRQMTRPFWMARRIDEKFTFRLAAPVLYGRSPKAQDHSRCFCGGAWIYDLNTFPYLERQVCDTCGAPRH
jgi:hypothetical protein